MEPFKRISGSFPGLFHPAAAADINNGAIAEFSINWPSKRV
jgi:hypothetical protein